MRPPIGSPLPSVILSVRSHWRSCRSITASHCSAELPIKKSALADWSMVNILAADWPQPLQAGQGLGRRPPRGRVAQGGARAAPPEEDGAVRGSEPPPPPPRPVCAGPRRGRARRGGGCCAGGAVEPARSGQKGARGLLGPPKPCAERAGGASGARAGAGQAPRPASPGRAAAAAGRGGRGGRWTPVRGGAGGVPVGGCAVGAPRRFSVPACRGSCALPRSVSRGCAGLGTPGAGGE